MARVRAGSSWSFGAASTVCSVLVVLVCMASTPAAEARAIRFDDALQACDTALPGGSREVPIVEYDFSSATPNLLCDTFTDPSLSGFSINLFGTTYDSLYINDNGAVSFGAAYSGAVSESLLDATVPVIAPLLSDAPIRAVIGYSGATFSIDFSVLAAPDSNLVLASSQLVIIDRGEGDFDLELNYGPISFDGIAQAGFTDGAGGGYLLPGSGVAGAFVGDDQALAGPICLPTSPTCSSFNAMEAFDIDPLSGTFALGRYRFNFVDGAPVAVPDTDVPEPATWLVLLAALLLLSRRRLQAAVSG